MSSIESDRPRGKSFLKWVGGKTRTAELLAGLAPAEYARYGEPFLGSAAVFFAARPAVALLSDLNEELVVCFQQVRDDPEGVMARLDGMDTSEEAYLRVRAQRPEELTPLERGARVIYLNKTGFRGLWRVNARGGFNVPYGRYDRPLYNRATVLAASAALAGTLIRHRDFAAAIDDAETGDWLFLDPPYVPAGGYSDFQRYTAGQFRAADHERLVEACRRATARGVRFLLTNTNNDAARALYVDFDRHVIPTRRDVHLDTAKRASTDLLVANYEIGDALARALDDRALARG
jgi:DNA adenine methylase